jgi:hypothetical protein
MKKSIKFLALILFAFVIKANAQVRVNVNLNAQPDWGPSGYDHADYYYFPDMDIYYNVPKKQYVYQDRGKWRFANSLPPQYRGQDLYHSYKVVLNEPRPYMHHDQYREKYASYRGRRDQAVLRDDHNNDRDRNQNNNRNRDQGNDRNSNQNRERDRRHH